MLFGLGFLRGFAEWMERFKKNVIVQAWKVYGKVSLFMRSDDLA